jgi:hypothetical protein
MPNYWSTIFSVLPKIDGYQVDLANSFTAAHASSGGLGHRPCSSSASMHAGRRPAGGAQKDIPPHVFFSHFSITTPFLDLSICSCFCRILASYGQIHVLVGWIYGGCYCFLASCSSFRTGDKGATAWLPPMTGGSPTNGARTARPLATTTHRLG